MDTLDAIETPLLPAERALLDIISHPDVNLNDMVAQAVGLRSQLERLSPVERDAVVYRLLERSASLRRAGAATEATLLDMVMRTLQRFLCRSAA